MVGANVSVNIVGASVCGKEVGCVGGVVDAEGERIRHCPRSLTLIQGPPQLPFAVDQVTAVSSLAKSVMNAKTVPGMSP